MELIIGSAMVSMIGLATASFTVAVAAGWTQSEQQFNAENASKRSGDQIEQVLEHMRYVAQSKSSTSSSPGSYVFYWSKDGVLTSADRKAQLGEMALIEYDAVGKTISIYQPKSTGLTAAQLTTLSADSWGDPTNPAIVTYFKSLDSVESKPIVGGTGSTIDVAAASFDCFTPVGAKPMTAYELNVTDGNAQGRAYGSVPQRAAVKPTNF